MAAAKKRESRTENVVHGTEPKFSKEQIAISEKYHNQRDLVDALLDDKKKYTFETVDNLIENYKKGQVK